MKKLHPSLIKQLDLKQTKSMKQLGSGQLINVEADEDEEEESLISYNNESPEDVKRKQQKHAQKKKH